jgi:phosphoribosyl-AMP cyclohydrolase
MSDQANSDVAMSDQASAGTEPVTAQLDLSTVRFNDQGLVPVVVQEATTGQVLMVAWMDAEAIRRTLDTRRATYWSRSRQTYWVKGETSGHTQRVRSLASDCDGDTLLMQVDQTGPACHTGTTTCFEAGHQFLTVDRPA